METIIPISKRKSPIHPKLIPTNYLISSDQFIKTSKETWKSFRILSIGFNHDSLEGNITNYSNFHVDFDNRTSINCKSLAEINRKKNRHLMSHPLVESNLIISKEKPEIQTIKSSDDSFSLKQYQKMLKESKKLEVERRKRSRCKQIIELIEGQMYFSDNFTSYKPQVKFNAESEMEKSKKSSKSFLNKCQSENILSTKKSSKNDLLSDVNYINRRLFHDNRINPLNINNEINNGMKPIKLLPGRPTHLTEKTLNDNFKTKPLPPISRHSAQECIESKMIDHLVTMKNNSNFYYSTKTNMIFPKIIKREHNDSLLHHKKNAKSEKKANNKISSDIFPNSISKRMTDRNIYHPPSVGHCNSPIQLSDEEEQENKEVFIPLIELQ